MKNTSSLLALGLMSAFSTTNAQAASFQPITAFDYEFSYGGLATTVPQYYSSVNNNVAPEDIPYGPPGIIPIGIFAFGFVVETAGPVSFAGETITFERGTERSSYDPLNLKSIYVQQQDPLTQIYIFGELTFGLNNEITDWNIFLQDFSTTPKTRSFFYFTSDGKQTFDFFPPDSSRPAIPDYFGYESIEDDVILEYNFLRFFHERGDWTLKSTETLCIENGSGPIELEPSDPGYPSVCLPSNVVTPIPLPASWIFGMLGLGLLGLFGRFGRATG